MIRFRSQPLGGTLTRLLVAVTALSLLGLAFGSLSALAANTRSVYFGTPEAQGGSGGGFDSSGNPVSGTLVFSPVTVGGKAFVTVLIRNDGGQTLNHIKFAGGTTADALDYNASYPKPAGTTSLPAGASFAVVFPSADCNPASGDGLMCDVGSLAAGAFKTYTIVITPPADAGNYHVWLTASWNEGWSSTGANADYTFAEGDIAVKTAGCDTAASSYFLPAELLSLSNPCSSQKASISSGALGGNGGFGSVGIDSGPAACPAGYSCYGSTVSVTVGDGSNVPGGVQWDVTWTGTKSLKGVIHLHDDYDAATNPFAYDVILFQKKFQCSTQLPTNCWVLTEASKGNVNPLTFRAVFVTPNNGKAGGFF